MVEFTKEGHVIKWLQGKDRSWAIVLAARAALRTVPGLAVLAGDKDWDKHRSR